MLALETGGGRFTIFQAEGLFLLGQRRSRARGRRFNFGFSGNGILHHIPFWRVQAANAKRGGGKTLPRINIARQSRNQKKHLSRRHGDTEKTQKQQPTVKVKTSTQRNCGGRGELKKINARP